MCAAKDSREELEGLELGDIMDYFYTSQVTDTVPLYTPSTVNTGQCPTQY